MKRPKVSFVIPFYNEEKNAGAMIEQIYAYAKKQKWDFEIIPVNDRSRDGTGKTLDEYAKKYQEVRPVHRENTGEQGNSMGLALMAGSGKAKGEIIIWTMGDRADDPKTYGEIVQKIERGFDMVFGSRYMQGGTWGSLDPTKAFLSSRGTVLARWMFNIKVHDITNAFRGFKRGLLDKIRLESTGFSISPEFALKAYLAGFKLGEVPTVYHNRVEGVSNFKLWRMSTEYLKVYGKIFLARWFSKDRL